MAETGRIIKHGQATGLEKQVEVAITEIQEGAEELMKKSISSLKIAGAKEVERNGINVIIITVPYKQIDAYHQIQGFLIPELEKKLDSKQVVLVGKRRYLPKTPEHGRRFKTIRPSSRTLRAVNESILEDVVFPTTIVAKRTHYDLNGKQVTYVTLDHNDRTRVEDRLPGFGAAYERLSGIKTVFEIASH